MTAYRPSRSAPGQSAELFATLAAGKYLMASTILSDQALGAYGTLTCALTGGARDRRADRRSPQPGRSRAATANTRSIPGAGFETFAIDS